VEFGFGMEDRYLRRKRSERQVELKASSALISPKLSIAISQFISHIPMPIGF
jgi:hypothetical protein